VSFDTNNCALGPDCRCVGEPDFFNCSNWGRSTLAAPRIGHAESHYTGQSKADLIEKLDARKRKMDKWNTTTNERLREIRHTDPVKHLAKKGVKVRR
jgi:hypothetical protein